MKKLSFALALIFLISVFLPACSGTGAQSVITINDTTQVNSEIFTYFLNDAYYSGNDLSQTHCIDLATSKCLEYVAVNTHFAESGKKLSQNDKAEIARETNSLWRIYGGYLSELGISKDTYFKIKQYEHYKEDLRFALYDTNGSDPINEDYIKQYFTANYVGIKYFYEELYTARDDAEINGMSESEKKAYEAEKNAAVERYSYISNIANYVNSSVYTIDEAFMAVTGEVSADISVSATVVGKNDTSFSQEFIDAVFKQAVGSAFIITNASHSYIYFIERVDLLAKEYDFYDEYRDKCLVAVSENFFINEINTWVQSYNTVRHIAVVNDCLKTVSSVDRSKYAGTDGYVFKGLQLFMRS